MPKAAATSKKKSALDGLDPKRRKYVLNRASGMKKTPAALDAGFTHSMARAAVAKVETPAVHAAFRELVQNALPPQMLVIKLAEGIDAEKSTISGEMVPDFKVRHDYLKTAAEWGDYVPREQAAVTVPIQVVIDL